jgi:hypothetical protein
LPLYEFGDEYVWMMMLGIKMPYTLLSEICVDNFERWYWWIFIKCNDKNINEIVVEFGHMNYEVQILVLHIGDVNYVVQLMKYD